jgi:hypothetical protein
MVMIDLDIPPGFDLLSEDLQTILEKTATESDSRLEKFSLTGTQAILYFNSLAPNETVTLPIRLRAKYRFGQRPLSRGSINTTTQPLQDMLCRSN